MSTIDSIFDPPSPLPPPPQSTGASELVQSGFATAQAYAASAFTEAVAFLSQLNGAAAELQTIAPIDGTLGSVDATVTAFVTPPLPQVPAGLAMNLPAVPSAPTLTPVQDIALGPAPTFDAQPPTLNIPAAPLPLSATVPLAPSLPDVAIPDSPDIVLPAVPSLQGINVPVEPLLNLPTFTAVTPDSPLAPAYIFGFSEQAYTSQLLQDLRSTLDSWINGISTGLAPAVEQAIWDRDRAREIVASSRKIQESIRMFAQRGFTKPPGALSLEIQQGLQDSQSTVIAASRDVMIKQADLEQSNRRFAFDQAWKVEEGLITYTNQIAQRAFDTAKYAQQVGIDIYREQAAVYAADVQAYAAQIDAYKAQLQGELTKLDLYRAEIDAQKLVGEINQQAIDVYRAQITAAQAVIDIFKTEVDAANTKAMINKTLIDSFAAQVGAYAETVRAKAEEYDGYATLVKAQSTLVDIYSTEASAYNSEVQGFKATVDALVAAKNIEIRVAQELPLDVFKTLTDAYRVQVGAEVDRVGALVKELEANVSVFSAEVQGETARVGSETEVYKADAQVLEAAGNLRVEAAKANVQTLIQQVNLLIESIKGGAQVAAQLAAASLSSVNLSGQIGDHVTYGVGYNVNQSAANNSTVSEVNTTSTSTSNSTSDNTSVSSISSTGTNTNTNYNFSN
jgi:hypothetical protein